jgi:hypothetical protein
MEFTRRRSLRGVRHGVNFYIESTSLALFALTQELWNGDVEVTEAFLARAFGISEVTYERLPVWRQPEDHPSWTPHCA